MGNQQAHRTVNKQVAGCGRTRSRAVGCACAAGADCGSQAGRPVAVVAAMAVGAAARTDRLVTWRGD